MNLKSTLISVSVDTNRWIIDLNWINIVNVFVQTDHQYSQPTAEVIPETLSYTGGYGPLDLTTYFIYAAAIIIVTYVRFHFLIPTTFEMVHLRKQCFNVRFFAAGVDQDCREYLST